MYNHWSNKEQNVVNAIKHINEMNDKYEKDILLSVINTTIYNSNSIFNNQSIDNSIKTKISIVPEDSVTAIINRYEGNTAVLNFASYKNPGGRYLDGSMAQEEALCSESTLYNVLKFYDVSYYHSNRSGDKNRSLYYNKALYSKDILFIRNNNIVKCDVLTCAAPNINAGRRYQGVSNKENEEVLDSRIKFVLNILKDNNVDTAILGAFGCGVFGCDPFIVSRIFYKYLSGEFKNVFKNVIFAIPDENSSNYITFKIIFSR